MKTVKLRIKENCLYNPLIKNLIEIFESISSFKKSFIPVPDVRKAYLPGEHNRHIDVKRKFVFTFLFLFFCTCSFAQQAFRRHFIIAYDVSTPFVNAQNNCYAYKLALINLFANKTIGGYSEAYQNDLVVEKNKKQLFFDRYHDEISFFHFGVAASEFDALQSAGQSWNGRAVIKTFENTFLKNKHFNWSSYSKNRSVTPTDYLTEALSMQPAPAVFGRGVTLSNLVYPLVLDKVDTNQYAQEYILIILSDFLTGATFGNTKDMDRVRDIFHMRYGITLPVTSPVFYIKNKIDSLATQYYKVDFFQYAFTPQMSEGKNPIGIVAYKIKPKVGVLAPEDFSLYIDGDLNLKQKGYKSTTFTTSKTKVKFTHNKNLILSSLSMSVVIPSSGKVVFDGVIARKNEHGIWESEYSQDADLMRFDSSELTYFLPSLKLLLDSSVNRKNFDHLVFRYAFNARYQPPDARPLNFIYTTERILPAENIHYATKAMIIIMYYLLPALVVIAILIWLLIYSRPQTLRFRIDGFLDSFETVNYELSGKFLTPYKAWDIDQQQIEYLPVEGRIFYNAPNFPLNWDAAVTLQLHDVTVPDGFELFLKRNHNEIKEFGLNTPMSIKKGSNNALSFLVGIRQKDITADTENPQLVKFSIDATVNESRLFIKTGLRDTITYTFHLGADLGDVWVGFDPGTSGSCVAVGSTTDNIMLCEDITRDKIIPSVIVFEKAADYKNNGNGIPESIYQYGSTADVLYPTTSKYQGFKSIKKLLGFKDRKEIVFDNGNVLDIGGKGLAGLLVKGLFKELTAYYEKVRAGTSVYRKDEKFNPLRAIVAIPNNYTISKIQDMVDCIDSLKQFKEIRYVYEAEAVLFYYLSNFSRLCKGETPPESETVLVFDMGGATINTTVVTTNKVLVNGRPKYDIDFLGKIGYGIGGDTIDYCICKFILSFNTEFPQLSIIDLVTHKVQLAKLAQEIKIEMIENYYTNKDYLITAYNLGEFINRHLDISISVDEDSVMYQFFKKLSGKFKLFEHRLFINTIYNNVKDAVNEVVALSEDISIDRIIFSGRSTFFPMIKETVLKQVKSKSSNAKSIVFNVEEAKIAVAQGACWYGINKNSVQLNNLKTNSSFGFKKTNSADRTDVTYFELVEMGRDFDAANNGISSFQQSLSVKDDFAFDGNKVIFYQVMGKDATSILAGDQKHKFSKIADIRLDQPTAAVAMKVNENDEVECAVVLQSTRKIITQGNVSDQEIQEANAEHYTWILK